MSFARVPVQITGLGAISPVGIGINEFRTSLREGITNFSIQEFERGGQLFRYPVAKVKDFTFKEAIGSLSINEKIISSAKRLRNISASTANGIYSALEAWADAGLHDADIDLTKVAIVLGGSNTQQAMLQNVQEEYRDKLQFINPNYGLNFFDTDTSGALSELLGIRGEGHSIGGASASGNFALIQGHRLINSGEYDVVVVVAPLMELSVYELQGFTALGAMARVDENSTPSGLCRPFDTGHCGFVYGQVSGCIILESGEHAIKRRKKSYASLEGYGVSMDANRNPNPSVEGEKTAMLKAIKASGIRPNQIDYTNTHGTASPTGDKTEVEALLLAGLEGVKANSTKSLIGHGLSAAGLVEAIATVIQMQEGFLHPSHNLQNPVSDKIDWILDKAQQVNLGYALSNSFGFGGINTSIILKNN
ncbi:MAG: hypothetical protein NVV82_29445 [Sporocytophaga sp.]|nr:hypothetical protein [Sporocytophaga sp.]